MARRFYDQQNCPQCQKSGMVCELCGYGGEVPDAVCDDQHKLTELCPSCLPNTTAPKAD